MGDTALIRRAKAGDSEAFGALAHPHRAALHKLAYRLVSHPNDAEDLVQESLLQAFRKIEGFRGEAEFRTWLFSITTRKCIDHLRKKRRWPLDCQDLGARQHVEDPDLIAVVHQVAETPGFNYDYREHIAYCFSCVGRALDPEESAAIVLREVLELTNAEAAKALGLSLSTFRHRLASARSFMAAEFEGRCALVGKQGACWQCESLRMVLPESVRGAATEPIADAGDDSETKLRKRLAIVREARLGHGTAGPLHDYILRFMNEKFG